VSPATAIALGANIGAREQSLARAVELLDAFEGLRIASVSSLYESPPWGDTDQPDFLNAVVVGWLEAEAMELLDYLKECEAAIGKSTVRRWGPRVIDLDLLAVGTQTSSSADLELPHPRMADRPFVYLPLREACDGLALPDCWKGHFAASGEGQKLESVTRRRELEGPFPGRPVARQLTMDVEGEEQTARLARTLAKGLRRGDVVALSGPLGAGKSVFVRALARELGIEGPLPSPTFTLCREYGQGRLSLQHWDFYRMESVDDLESAGFPPAKGDFDVVAVEWADRFPDEVGEAGRVIRVELSPLAESSEAMRRLTIDFPAESVEMRAHMGRTMGC